MKTVNCSLHGMIKNALFSLTSTVLMFAQKKLYIYTPLFNLDVTEQRQGGKGFIPEFQHESSDLIKPPNPCIVTMHVCRFLK